MKTVAYYSDLNNPDNNFCFDNVFLRVNCAGRAVYEHSPVGRSVRSDYYMMILFKGEIVFEKPAAPRSMRPGDLFVIEANTPFDYHAVSPGVTYYWVHFTGSDAKKLLGDCGIATNTLYSVGLGEAIPQHFLSLFLAFMRRDPLCHTERAAILLSLLVTLGKILDENTRRDSEAAALVLRSTAYIHEHLFESLSVSALAALEYLSPGRFRQVFRQIIGISPMDYIISLRINTACDLLRHTATPIGEIAAKVGYPDARYFSRLFYDRTGLTPSAFRRSGK